MSLYLFPPPSNAVALASLLVCDVTGSYRPAEPAEVLQAALRVLAGQLRGTEMLSSPPAVRDFLRIKLGMLEWATPHQATHARAGTACPAPATWTAQGPG